MHGAPTVYDPRIHHRRSIRLKGHDYAGGGTYFVTICAHRDFAAATGRTPFCGPAGSPGMVPLRQIIDEEWRRSAELRPYVHLDAFVTMPDHFHALITLDVGASSLGYVIGAFKAAVTRRCRAAMHVSRVWHRNYYERVIRGAEDLESVRHYIRMNPWRNIIHFGKGMRGIGNPSLWHLPKIGMLCSRNCPEDVLAEAERRAQRARAPHCVISGFHSPPERAIMAALLESDAQLICCPAWGIDTIKLPKEWLPALEANRMLVIEMSNGDANLAAARERNEFVMRTADQVWVPYVSPGGMLARMVGQGGIHAARK